MDTHSREADRWMYLAGPLFTVLVIVSFVVQGAIPAEDDAAADVVREVAENDAGIAFGAFVWIPAAVLLLVFACRLRASVDDRARAPRALLVGGATVFAAGVGVSSAVNLALVSAAQKGFEESAQALNLLNAAMWVPIVVGAAALLIGAGLAVVRTAILPAWLGWVALVVGVVTLIGPGGYLGFLLTPIWVGAAGVLLYLRKREVTVVEV